MRLLMTMYDFIFTKKSPEKYYRHIVFWVTQYIFWAFWATGFFYGFSWEYLIFQLRFHGYFVLDMGYTYIVVYYFSPKYLLTKRFFKFGISVFIITLFIYVLYTTYRFWSDGGLAELSWHEQLLMLWFILMNFIIMGPPVVCAMFLVFKMLKNYYEKMDEKIALVKENANAELQFLKAQVHPHFLFNTLNNIYSFTLNKSPKAGGLVLKLSDTLKYMINDCDAPLVPLEKELKMLKDYIELEKVRYGNRLNIQIDIPDGYNNKMITPLLMIPFVENSFKHGTSKMLKDPWIKLFIQADEDVLHFTLTNSKPADEIVNVKGGIGLNNVKKRLGLLYPFNHLLTIESSVNTFTVNMQIPLQNMNGKEQYSTREEIIIDGV